MSAEIKIPFELGVQIWWVGHGHQEKWITCPECVGSKKLRVIQGNGQEFEIDCAACTLGYEPPSGKIKQIVYRHVPTPYTPRRVIGFEANGIVNYTDAPEGATCYSYIHSNDMFQNETDCLVACEQRNVEREKWQAENLLSNLKSKKRDLAWSVHYWGRKLRDLERDLELTRTRLTECKDRAAVKGPVAADRRVS